MPFFFGADHMLGGHVDDSLNQYDSHGTSMGGTDLHGAHAVHHDAQHGYLGSSEHHADGSMSHFDHSHGLLGTTEHHGGVTYHFDPTHHLTGTEQVVNGHIHSFDALHRLTGMSDAHFSNLQADLTSAFRRLF